MATSRMARPALAPSIECRGHVHRKLNCLRLETPQPAAASVWLRRCVHMKVCRDGMRAAIAAVVFLSLAPREAAARGDAPDIGSTVAEKFELDTGSVRRDGDLVHYRVRSRSNFSFRSDYEGQIKANCRQRLRAELTGVSRFGDSPPQWSSSEQMRSVFDGTRQAKELDAVCKLAGWVREADATVAAAQRPDKTSERMPLASVPAPPPAGTRSPPSDLPADAVAPLNRSASVATDRHPVSSGRRALSTGPGFLLSAQGLVVTSGTPLSNCGRLEIHHGRSRRVAHVLMEDGRKGLALLKVGGGPYTTLPRSAGPLASGAAVTVVGRLADADSGPAVAAGVVWGQTGGQLMVAVPPGYRTLSGVVLDDRGAVAGFVDGQAAVRFGLPLLAGPPVADIGSFLASGPVAWPASAEATPPSLARLLRRGISAAVQVICHL